MNSKNMHHLILQIIYENWKNTCKCTKVPMASSFRNSYQKSKTRNNELSNKCDFHQQVIYNNLQYDIET